MTDEAKAARREYERQWRAKNPDKVKAKMERYWMKKAAEMLSREELTDGKQCTISDNQTGSQNRIDI